MDSEGETGRDRQKTEIERQREKTREERKTHINTQGQREGEGGKGGFGCHFMLHLESCRNQTIFLSLFLAFGGTMRQS